MYTILRTIIISGDYTLEDITYKINTLWVQNQIAEREKNELLALAVEHLDPERERPEVQEQLEYLAGRIDAQAELLSDVIKRVTALEGGSSEEEDYPAWELPIAGLTTDYQYGAIVSHNGKLWISTYNGQNVWEPGVYGWEEYTPDEADN